MTDDLSTFPGNPFGAEPGEMLAALRLVAAAATTEGDAATIVAAVESAIGAIVPGVAVRVTGAPSTTGDIPIVVDGERWGSVALRSSSARRGDDERVVRALVELLSPCFALIAARERLAELVTTDALTGLPNTRVLRERIAAEMERTGRHGRALALVRLDIDTIHHGASGPETDAIVTVVANRLGTLTRGGETIARIGTESFAWILPETDGLGGQAAADRARRVVSTPNPGAPTVTLSAGVCDSFAADTPAELLALADEAVRRARRAGGDLTIRHTGRASGVAGR